MIEFFNTQGLTLGKYIPIDVLIDTLLGNKNAEILRLQKDIQLLKSLMTPEQIAAFERQVIFTFLSLTKIIACHA